MVTDNDIRGWVMTALSGIACTIGASVICIDVLILFFKKDAKFRIEKSTGFLSSSLSLSSGVMLFSALSSLLPTSRDILRIGGFSSQATSWILISCFVLGGIGIQTFSRILHRYIPSHVVDCDHAHVDGEVQDSRNGSLSHRPRPVRVKTNRLHLPSWEQASMDAASPVFDGPRKYVDDTYGTADRGSHPMIDGEGPEDLVRRPSMQAQLSAKVLKMVSTTESQCNQGTKCRGFSGVCSPECLKSIRDRIGSHLSDMDLTHPAAINMSSESQPLLQGSSKRDRHYGSGNHLSEDERNNLDNSQASLQGTQQYQDTYQITQSSVTSDRDHHHHVPDNAFLSVGVQTSLAIALHKLPEGFITYATNHANPKLGFSVFLAIFVHNITEGFAMALPLYLAIKSRPKAIIWSALLGGVSQPLGAALAALWFFLSRSDIQGDEGEGVYGVLFAITSGVMTSVALQLFSEATNLNPNRTMCMIFVFVGMAVLGISGALTS